MNTSIGLIRNEAEWLQKKTDVDCKVKLILVEEAVLQDGSSTGLLQSLNGRDEKSNEKDNSIETLNKISNETSNEALSASLPINNSKDETNMKLYDKTNLIFDFLGFFCGIRIRYMWEPTKSPAFWFMITCLNICLFEMCYTIHVHQRNNQHLRILEPLALSGATVSCYLKLYCYMKHRILFLSALFTLKPLIRMNKSGPVADVIESGLLKLHYLLKVYLLGIVVCLLCYVLLPAYLMFVEHLRVTLIPFEIIFCDTSTNSGLLAANIVQAILGMYFGVATAFFGAVFITLIYCYTFKSQILAEDFKQLDKMWKSNLNIHISIKHQFLINICKKRQDLNEYLDIIKQIFALKLIGYFACNYLSQIICLYDIQKGWRSGYSLAAGMLIEMMFYCILGTYLTIAHDDLQYAIYHTNWYKYDLKSQQMIQMLLFESQNLTEIQLGSIGPLNLVTGVAISKSIYSYYTVMSELF